MDGGGESIVVGEHEQHTHGKLEKLAALGETRVATLQRLLLSKAGWTNGAPTPSSGVAAGPGL